MLNKRIITTAGRSVFNVLIKISTPNPKNKYRLNFWLKATEYLAPLLGGSITSGSISMGLQSTNKI